jgi:hypothetical protein
MTIRTYPAIWALCGLLGVLSLAPAAFAQTLDLDALYEQGRRRR